MTWHPILRAQLADALLAAGPDAPTLCEGWRSRHLAAHVVLRESSLTVGAGIAVPGLAARSDAAIDDLAQTAAGDGPFRDLVARVADGPPRWHPTSWAGDAANVVEFFVHTEDVRRGGGPVPPRELDPALVDELWRRLLQTARLPLRRAGVGVVLVRQDGQRRRVRGPGGGHGTVVVRGDVPELLMWVHGRGAAADVDLEGDPSDVAALRSLLPVA